MSDLLRIVVPASPWPRGAEALSVAAPPGFARASVRLEGDDRPLPCQVEHGEAGDRLWWTAPAAPAGLARRFLAFAEDRRKRAPRRVGFKPGPGGLEARVRGEAWAELLAPAFGPPRLRLHYRGGTLLRAALSAGPGAWRLAGEPLLVQGPVFGLVRLDHERFDALGRTALAVRTEWRFFDGPAARLAADLHIEAAATTGPAAFRPALALEFAAAGAATVPTGLRVGMPEGTLPAPWLAADGAAAAFAVCSGADDAAAVGAAHHRAALALPEERLALGARRSWRLRFLRGTDRHAFRRVPAAYRDFRFPAVPFVEAPA